MGSHRRPVPWRRAVIVRPPSIGAPFLLTPSYLDISSIRTDTAGSKHDAARKTRGSYTDSIICMLVHDRAVVIIDDLSAHDPQKPAFSKTRVASRDIQIEVRDA